MTRAIDEIRFTGKESLDSLLKLRESPLVVRGLVNDWELVQAANEGSDQFLSYLKRFDADKGLTVFHGQDIAGRIFYSDDHAGFNFQRSVCSLEEFSDRVKRPQSVSGEETYYIGSTLIEHWFPDLVNHLPLDLKVDQRLLSLWMGSKTTIAPHFDFPRNLACVVCGERRFTLFAPEHIQKLYPGPLEFTPAGQPISMLDLDQADLDQFPMSEQLEDVALTATLGAGDAIYIPSMWWHSVQGLQDFNALINYWWRDTPSYLGSPLNALRHALLSLNGLPATQRQHWRNVFDYYLAPENKEHLASFPNQQLGSLGELDQTSALRLKEQLIRSLQH